MKKAKILVLLSLIGSFVAIENIVLVRNSLAYDYCSEYWNDIAKRGLKDAQWEAEFSALSFRAYFTEREALKQIRLADLLRASRLVHSEAGKGVDLSSQYAILNAFIEERIKPKLQLLNMRPIVSVNSVAYGLRGVEMDPQGTRCIDAQSRTHLAAALFGRVYDSWTNF